MKFNLIVVCLMLALLGCAKSSTGRNQIMLFSNNDLNKMGIQSFEELKGKQKISTDKALNDYVQCVAGSITQHVPKSIHGGDWEVVVFDSEQVNAFALPGGKIGVYTGILNVAEDQHQLGAIIGHEVGHVIEHHSNERLSANMAAQAGMVAADVFLTTQSAKNKNLWMAGLGLGIQFGLVMPYSRTHEREADIVGQNLMAKSGFKPSAAMTLWVNMGKHSKGAPPEFMSTHPSHKTRIGALKENLVKAQGYLNNTTTPNCKKTSMLRGHSFD